ncbi:polycystin-1-like protein 2 [Amphiura filiformis]|uniref:polycystin-1-like protein 2 n=1 Tax=Amphiura filiformis TaxID=82378 RepID=UPI003B20BDC4
MQSATQLVTSITSVLNAEVDKTSGEDVTKTDKQEKRKKVREFLIDALTQVEVRDMESLEQLSAATAQVTQQQQEVSIEAQVKMTDLYLRMGKFLKDQSKSDVGGQVVEASARYARTMYDDNMQEYTHRAALITFVLARMNEDSVDSPTSCTECTWAKVVYLKDNDPRAHYRYHITIFTGMRKNAGTTAIVTITLHGNFGSSIPHVLTAKDQKILQRNSIDSFILTTHQSLGILTDVRVWHDNSGSSPEWYISRILVHDLENDRWWYFLCRSWLAVDSGGSKIDKTFPAATPEDLNEFKNLVLSKSVRDIKDNHIWFSVFLKPPQSYFTRLQRASCCLQLLLTSMTMNIIFYDAPLDPNLQSLEFGSIQIPLSTILVGVQASLMSIPASVIIDTIFRNSKPRFVAVPDPLQAHSSVSLAAIRFAMGDRFRRITQRFSQQFHFGRRESNSSEQDIVLDQVRRCNCHTSDTTLSVYSSSSTVFEWFRDELKSSSQLQSDIDPSMPSSNILNGKILDDTNLDAQTQSMEYHEEAVSKVKNEVKFDSNTKESMASASVAIEIPSDSNPSTSSTNAKLQKIEDGVNWYKLELKESLPSDIKTTNVNVDNAEQFYSASNSTICEDISHTTIHSDNINSSDNFDGADYGNVKSNAYEDYLVTKINECRQNLCDKPSEEFSTENGKVKAIRKLDLLMKLQGWEEESIQDEEEEESYSGQGFLPWWCIYIAWTLTLISWTVCAYFILQYGLRFGLDASINWLVSMMVSIIQSVVIVQPIKVVVLAAVFAIFLKTHQLDDVGAQFFRNWKPPKITTSSEDKPETTETIQRFNYVRAIYTLFYKPPPASSVVKAQEKRRIAAKVQSMFRAFIGQVIFVFFVLEIAYTQQNSDSFYLGQSMRDKYDGANEVLTVSDLYDWMSDFIPETYMDDPLQLTDNNMLVGSVRLRQIRVKPDLCKVSSSFEDSFSSCKSPLKTNSIDRGSYGPAWRYRSTKKHRNDPWNYQNKFPGSYYHIASMGYDTGGFSAYLGTNSQKAAKVLSDLKENDWINENTWAVFIEWTIYNANVNLFSVNTVLFEVDMIGSLQVSSEFSIVRLHRYTSQFDIFVRVLEGVYFIIVMVMIYTEYCKWKNLGSDYFDFWNCLNLAIIASSICAIAFYVLRHGLGLQAMKRHREDQNQFVSFSRVAFINQLVIQFISLIVFSATLKCAKVLHYNTSIRMLQHALKNFSREFVSFTFGVVVALVCFAAYARLEFGKALYDFKTFLASLNMLFIAITGGLDNLEGVVEEFPIRAFCFFIAFCFFAIFVLFQLYVSFILATLRDAREHPKECEDHDVIAAIVNWIIDRFSVDQE